MKSIALSIIALLVISTFAMAFALADESTTVEDSTAVANIQSADAVVEQPLADQTTVTEVVAETQAIAPTEQAPAAQQRYAGVARVTYGNGFAVKSDNTDAERLLGFWASVKYVSVDPAVLKQLRQQYKNQSAKLKEEIAKLTTDKVVVKSTGRIAVGLGARMEKFKLLKKELTNTSATFYVLPINENVEALKDAADADINAKSVGELKIDAKIYPHLTTWTGTLTLNSGKYAGTWTTTLMSHSIIGAKGLFGKKVVANIRGGQAATNVKPGLLARLQFWKKQ
jgi:hypothetical protein